MLPRCLQDFQDYGAAADPGTLQQPGQEAGRGWLGPAVEEGQAAWEPGGEEGQTPGEPGGEVLAALAVLPKMSLKTN